MHVVRKQKQPQSTSAVSKVLASVITDKMSDLEENDEVCVDADTCSESELNRLFSDSLVLSSEQCATNDYILFLDSTR